MTTNSTLPGVVEFGRWRIVPRRREVLHDGLPSKLAGRAFDLLVALIEARGAVVSKDALIQRVWPGRIIEENTLEAQIAALRRALGSDRDLVRTVSGRGYQFVGEINEHSDVGSPERPFQPYLLPCRNRSGVRRHSKRFRALQPRIAWSCWSVPAGSARHDSP